MEWMRADSNRRTRPPKRTSKERPKEEEENKYNFKIVNLSKIVSLHKKKQRNEERIQ